MDDTIQKYISKFNTEHTELYHNDIPDSEALNWIENNVPLFFCDDKQIEETYYFRWWTYRKHIKTTPDGTVITEFLPLVPWAGEHNVISASVDHHIAEGRWLRNKEIIKSDIRFFLLEKSTGTATSYSNALIYSASKYCLDFQDSGFAEEILPDLKRLFALLENKHRTKYGLYYSIDDRDGMEYSISGNGLRVTINSYMYANALYLGRLCRLLEDPEAERYVQKAEEIRERIDRFLWDGPDGFYKTVPMKDPDTAPDFSREDPDRNVREETGFIPFQYEGLCTEEKEKAYRYLRDKQHFEAPSGITTADMAHPQFLTNPVRHECLWDGPVWPFATSQTMTGLYTLLRRKDSPYITRADYMALLKTYSESHVLYERGKKINWIDEDIEPFTGQWISRDLIRLDHIYNWNHFAKERGAEYNHSSFCDLVLSGACGIEITGGELRISPLCIGTWGSFRVKNLQLNGIAFDLLFDGRLKLFRNGTEVASGETSLTYRL